MNACFVNSQQRFAPINLIFSNINIFIMQQNDDVDAFAAAAAASATK